MRLRLLIRQQHGIALVMAIGILGILTLTGATLIFYANSNARTASYSKESASAYDLAEAGINEAFSVLYDPDNNALNRYLLGWRGPDPITGADLGVVETTRELDRGSVTWSGKLNLDIENPAWTITSTGRLKNPTGSDTDVTRTITAVVPVTAQLTATATYDAWNWVYSEKNDGNSATCDTTIDNNPNFASALYVEGDLCLLNSAEIDAGPLLVRGAVHILHKNGRIGTSSAKIDTVQIGGGCYYENGSRTISHLGVACHNGDPNGNNGASKNYDGDNIWVSGLGQSFLAPPLGPGPAVTIPTGPAPVAKPLANFEEWYKVANPGPTQPCVIAKGAVPNGTSSWATAFDVPPPSGVVVKDNNNPTFSLTPATGYTCKTPGGELSWNPTNSDHPDYGPARTLTVRGTIYIDGSVLIDAGGLTGSDKVRYEGIAAIYMSGSLYFHQTNLCAVQSGSNCDWTPGAWDPNQDLLVFSADGDANISPLPAGDSILVRQSQFQGAFYGTNKVELDTNTQTQGPMVAYEIKLDNSIFPHTFPSDTQVPFGIPGNPIITATVGQPKIFPN